MRLSLKVAALCAAATAVPLIAASLIIGAEVSSQAGGRAILALRSEARSAASIYDKRLDEMRSAVQSLSYEIALKDMIDNGGGGGIGNAARARLQDLLGRARDDLSLDFLIVADQTGSVIARHNDLPGPGETVLQPDNKNPIIAKLMAEGPLMQVTPVAGSVVERGEWLARMWLDKIARVDGATGSEALMIEAGAPIYVSGRFAGILLIGQMLNNYYVARAGASPVQIPVVTEVRQTLYPELDKDAGAVVALGDTIIASSVRGGAAAEPMLRGQKRDPTKSEQAIRSGAETYVVAWQPIRSLDGAEIAAVGVALPAADLQGRLARIRVLLLAAVGLALAIAGAVGMLFGRAVSARVNRLSEAVTRMSVGELSTAVRDRGRSGEPGPVRALVSQLGPRAIGENDNPSDAELNSHAQDEIGKLAERLDQMRDSFRQAIERLRKR